MNTKILKKGFDSLFFPPAGPPKPADDNQAFIDVWTAVGNDIKQSMDDYGKESKEFKEQT